MTQAILEIKHLKKSYGQNEVLKDISLTVHKGEVISIIGSSGSGKSTFLRSINLLETPTDGQILYHGQNVLEKGYDLTQYREKLGMVFQSFNLFENLNVLENTIVAQTTVLKRERTEAEKIAKENLEKVGMGERYWQAKPKQLSGGQKQRVAIARALANDPEILISDESTSALDPKTTKQILSLLQDLNKKLGLTVVMITHEMQIVKDICNRVAVMQNGQLLEEGSVLDIFSNPQEDLTQEFIETAAGIEDALTKINAQPLVKNLPSSALLVQLKYAGSSTDEPLLTEIFKDYGVSSNILYGNLEILGDTPVGELVVVLDGEADKVLAAQKAIENAGVSLQVLKKGAQ